MFDLAFHNLRLVDPVNTIDKVCNIGIENGKIAEISSQAMQAKTKNFVDLNKYVALPGVIDIHTHLTDIFAGSMGGCQMLAKAGVCTTLDLAGPSTKVYEAIQKYGSGINVATLEAILPEDNVPTNNPNSQEIRSMIQKALDTGSLGCKILGGHFPLSLKSSAECIRIGNEEKAYMCWHAGSTSNVNSIDSMRDVLECTGKGKLHLAHINSYCRGFMYSEAQEVAEAIELLYDKENIYSESYLAATNGTSFRIDKNGELASKNTANNLLRAGYANSLEGLISAVRDGYAHVFAPCGVETAIYYKEEGVEIIKATDCNVTGGFNINPPISRLTLALAKRKEGSFVVDALSTDGGGIPRNVLVTSGLALVKMNMLTLADFVRKSSVNPARMIGAKNKGHLGIGADADLTIVDLETCTPVMTVVNGKICMWKGIVTNTGGTVLTTERGEKWVREEFALPTVCLDPQDMLAPCVRT